MQCTCTNLHWILKVYSEVQRNVQYQVSGIRYQVSGIWSRCRKWHKCHEKEFENSIKTKYIFDITLRTSDWSPFSAYQQCLSNELPVDIFQRDHNFICLEDLIHRQGREVQSSCFPFEYFAVNHCYLRTSNTQASHFREHSPFAWVSLQWDVFRMCPSLRSSEPKLCNGSWSKASSTTYVHLPLPTTEKTSLTQFDFYMR